MNSEKCVLPFFHNSYFTIQNYRSRCLRSLPLSYPADLLSSPTSTTPAFFRVISIVSHSVAGCEEPPNPARSHPPRTRNLSNFLCLSSAPGTSVRTSTILL